MAVRIMRSAPIAVFAFLCKLMHINAMTEKERRQSAIADLISGHSLASQDELAERLAGLGFRATQATVSRDLEQLGAVKLRRGGRLAYALPEQVAAADAPGFRLESVVRDWVRSIHSAGNLLVMKTPAGSAHIVGVALDRSPLAEIVGTICGDDTIFVACRDAAAARSLAAKLRQTPSAQLQ